MRRSQAKADRPADKATAGKPATTTMGYVYLLVSLGYPDQHYVGLTHDLKKRVADHNRARSKHTAKFIPWKLAAYFAFADEHLAVSFERYLKTGSGKAFLKRHLLAGNSEFAPLERVRRSQAKADRPAAQATAGKPSFRLAAGCTLALEMLDF